MANTIQVKRSATPSAVPTTGQLALGEIAVNTYDGKVYIKKDNGTASIVEVGAGGGGGLTSLNSQTGATQTFAVGTSGTNFAVSSASNVHTFNLPDASATNRGALTSANWTTFNNKLGSLNSQTGATQTFAVGTTGTNFAISSSGDVHTFNLPDASASNRGVVTTGTQTFAGAKTFNSDLTVNGVRVGKGPSGNFDNLAVGYQALNASNVGAYYNTCIGTNAGAAIQHGDGNTCVGNTSGAAIVGGNYNCLYGYYSGPVLTGSNCIGIGLASLRNATTATNLVAIGYESLRSHTTNQDSTAVGYFAGYNSTGSYNTFLGSNADTSSAGAASTYCLSLGYSAQCTGSNSIAIGRSASAAADCFDLRFGNAQRVVGDANGQIGINTASPGAQLQVTSGSASRKAFIVKAAASPTVNIFEIQDSAATAMVSLNSGGQLLVGRTSAVLSTEAIAAGNASGQQYLTIDGGASGTGSGGAVLARNGGTTICAMGGYSAAYSGGTYDATPTLYFNAGPKVMGLAVGVGTWPMKFNTTTNAWTYDTSRRSAKDNIRPSTYGLEHVLRLQPRQFNYHASEQFREDVGFIADEVYGVIPELAPCDADGEPAGVSYDRLTAVLCAAIQELAAKNDALEARIAALEG